MPDPNVPLRAARERTPSRIAPGECLSRADLAEAVNAYLWQATGRRYELDAHHVAKWERGAVRFPIAPYRAALRAVLRVASDAALGFTDPRRVSTGGREVALPDGRWRLDGILGSAEELTRFELLNRRDLPRSATVGGAALLAPLNGWLEPLAGWPSRAGAVFSVAEVDAMERVVEVFRGWRSMRSGLARGAVAGQLADVTERLRDAPDDPHTRRVFLAAAELAKIAGAMAFDSGTGAAAQRYYLLAVQMAKAAGEDLFAAVSLAALARQSFDMQRPADGLELVQLAQLGARTVATPGLRALLATREAWGHAQQGSTYAFHRAVGSAEEAFAARNPGDEPRWTSGLDDAELAGVIGARFRDLAAYHQGQAKQAATYIGRALTLRDASRTRNRAFDLIGLARVELITREPEHASTLVRQALPLIDTRQPGRLARKLGDWHREAEPFAAVPAVRDTRDELTELITTT